MNDPEIDKYLSPFCYLLGYIAGVVAFWWLARHRGLRTEGVASVMAVGVVGGLIFGTVIQRLVTGVAGKTIIRVVFGGCAAIIVYKWAIGPNRPLGDLFAFALSAGEAVGRWGCFSEAAATVKCRIFPFRFGSTAHGGIRQRYTFPWRLRLTSVV